MEYKMLDATLAALLLHLIASTFIIITGGAGLVNFLKILHDEKYD